jgi:hypothetical protein
MAPLLITREQVEGAFADLGRIARDAGKIVDIAVFGGVALMLTFPARATTRDVDAVALNDQSFLREAVKHVAAVRDWPEDWLNDAVKGFLSERQFEPGVMQPFRSYPSEAEPGLRVYIARPEYLLAMKCIAMRLDTPAPRDVEDIRLLVRHLRLTKAADVLDIVVAYYPNRRIRPKTQFGIEEIMDQLAQERLSERRVP